MDVNMNEGILEHIPFEPDVKKMKDRLRVRPGSSIEPEFERMLEQACQVARPRAAWRFGYIETRDQNQVVINGQTFTSRVLAVNLQKAHRVFACLATCGKELEDWSLTFDDILLQFWADSIKQTAVHIAFEAVKCHFNEAFHPGKTGGMAPGSLEDWPLTEQRPFFRLMAPLDEAIGVSLTESCLMLPTKSISAFRFPTEENFESCLLCQRENCPGRQAAYDPQLYEKRFN
jgi:hypothetical protein